MKYKVLKKFEDKDTKQLHDINTFYSTKDNDRANELIEKGFISKTTRKQDKGSDLGGEK